MAKPEKVLIIDDDPIVLEITSEWLRIEGYDVITHDNAMGSSRIVLKERPKYVLVDVMMPGMSGDELVKMLIRRAVIVLVVGVVGVAVVAVLLRLKRA